MWTLIVKVKYAQTMQCVIYYLCYFMHVNGWLYFDLIYSFVTIAALLSLYIPNFTLTFSASANVQNCQHVVTSLYLDFVINVDNATIVTCARHVDMAVGYVLSDEMLFVLTSHHCSDWKFLHLCCTGHLKLIAFARCHHPHFVMLKSLCYTYDYDFAALNCVRAVLVVITVWQSLQPCDGIDWATIGSQIHPHYCYPMAH